jgi:ubiquinone/menaquinone biosynthesis C-methylase UbiE
MSTAMDFNSDKREEMTRKAFANVADSYQERFMNENMYDSSYLALLEYLPPSASLLELGCGPGNITRFLLIQRSDLKITATDIAEPMLNLARKNNPAAKHQILSIRKVCEINIKQDAIVVGFVFPYLSSIEIRKFFSDAFDILNNDGVVYFSYIASEASTNELISGSVSNDPLVLFKYSEKDMMDLIDSRKFLLQQTFEYSFTSAKGEVQTHQVCIVKKI